MARKPKRSTKPWHKWYHSSWLGSETRQAMNAAERGVYRDCLDYCYAEGSIPSDTALLAKLMALDRTEFESAWKRVRCNFKPVDGDPTRLTHHKVLEVLRESERYRRRASESGRRGAARRWQRPARATDAVERSISDSGQKQRPSDSEDSLQTADSKGKDRVPHETSIGYPMQTLCHEESSLNREDSVGLSQSPAQTPSTQPQEWLNEPDPNGLAGPPVDEWFNEFRAVFPNDKRIFAAETPFKEILSRSQDPESKFEQIMAGVRRMSTFYRLTGKKPSAQENALIFLLEHRYGEKWSTGSKEQSEEPETPEMTEQELRQVNALVSSDECKRDQETHRQWEIEFEAEQLFNVRDLEGWEEIFQKKREAVKQRVLEMVASEGSEQPTVSIQ